MDHYVKSITSDDEFDAILNSTDSSKLIIADFSITKGVKPIYAELSLTYRSVLFLTVDIDNCKKTVETKGIKSLPTFQCYKGGVVLDTVTGSDLEKIETAIHQHQGNFDSSSLIIAGHSDLMDAIKIPQVEILNKAECFTTMNLFIKDSKISLESDVDEQLIFVIPFNQVVKLHSLRITAPIDKAPKTIKTYINRPSTLSFDETDSIPSIETLTLTSSTYTPSKTNPTIGTALVPLRFVKYQSVHSITLFIEDNLGDDEVTCLNGLEFFGSLVESTRALSELKEGRTDTLASLFPMPKP